MSLFSKEGRKEKEITINITSVFNFFKKKKKEKEPEFEWRYEHTNRVCDQVPQMNLPYCPGCGGELVYRRKKKV